MATTRNATTTWEGTLFEGAGRVELQSSGVGTVDVSWPSRAEEANGKTSPEELIAAAHSTCFSMALSHALAQAGTPPSSSAPAAPGRLPRDAGPGARPGRPPAAPRGRDRDLPLPAGHRHHRHRPVGRGERPRPDS